MRNGMRCAGLACLLTLLAAPLWAAGSATVTVSAPRADASGARHLAYTVAWTSDASGDVSGHAFTVQPGKLVSVRMTPGGGAAQPTDLYDVTLSDGDVADILAGAAVDRSNSASSLLQWDPTLWQDGSRALDLVVAHAGDSNTGTVVILVQIQ